MAIRSEGTLWAWGNKTVGQLGNGTWDDAPGPRHQLGLASVTSKNSIEGSSATATLN